MKRIWLLSAVLTAACASAQSSYILELKPGSDVQTLASEYQFTIERSWSSTTAQGYKVSTIAALPAAQITAIQSDPAVVDFEPDVSVPDAESDSGSRAKAALQALGSYAFDPTSVSYYGATVRNGYVNQPVAQLIELSAAHQIASTGNSIVAIIDTGIDPNHPAFQGVVLPGFDFTRNRPGASELADLDQSTVAILDQSTVAILDSKNAPLLLSQSTVAILDHQTAAALGSANLPGAFGHGTMVAGLVHLVAPSAQILPLKAFHADGTANLSDIVQAIHYAADNGAKVIVMSFTFTTLSPDLQNAVQYALAKGVVCVAAAGNDGSEHAHYPASIRGVIGVGSTNFSDRRSPFSNYDNSASTSAPGEATVTTYPGNNYAAVWGTSFSTPLVAGAVVLFDQIRPRLGNGGLQDILEAGVHIDQDMGDARLDVLKSLNYLLLPQ